MSPMGQICSYDVYFRHVTHDMSDMPHQYTRVTILFNYCKMFSDRYCCHKLATEEQLSRDL
jgi:hypothetical protein